jgi:hypothetical protein
MKNHVKYWQGLATAMLVIGALIFLSMEALAAGPRAVELGQPAKELSAEWWQLVYSLPPSVNPVLDTTGANCVVGQRGDVWFLAGSFGGSVTRTCSVPEGKVLFFPVLNASFFDSPGACGQGPGSLSVKYMRDQIASYIDGATNMSVTLNHRPVGHIQRVRSEVFEIAMPKDNLYADLSCEGVFSPAVDDGYYAHLDPLRAGTYQLKIYGEVPAFGSVQDITYNLTVVPVTLK